MHALALLEVGPQPLNVAGIVVGWQEVKAAALAPAMDQHTRGRQAGRLAGRQQAPALSGKLICSQRPKAPYPLAPLPPPTNPHLSKNSSHHLKGSRSMQPSLPQGEAAGAPSRRPSSAAAASTSGHSSCRQMAGRQQQGSAGVGALSYLFILKPAQPEAAHSMRNCCMHQTTASGGRALPQASEAWEPLTAASCAVIAASLPWFGSLKPSRVVLPASM
jgi:hypothetical protein